MLHRRARAVKRRRAGARVAPDGCGGENRVGSERKGCLLDKRKRAAIGRPRWKGKRGHDQRPRRVTQGAMTSPLLILSADAGRSNHGLTGTIIVVFVPLLFWEAATPTAMAPPAPMVRPIPVEGFKYE